ncbi:MAG: DegT/DnrJ/EryC1/StrS family aminotransferase [Gemmataceae bacterium]|nr:DegT/DnrJ/EryC1/StrS family aminotransferase [Gemmataceae bacterium]
MLVTTPPELNRRPGFQVPYSDLAAQAAAIKDELMTAFETVLDSGRYILGPQVAAFEREFAFCCNVGFAVGVGSGTCALHLALRGLGVRAGDEVITAPNSFAASAAAIALVGARPVFADIGPDLNIDPEALEMAITPRTRGIIPIHFTGRPARMPEILEIAERYNLFVLEDAAQAVGAQLHGRPVGSWGRAACFSMHPLKNLHAFGDGGIVTTRDSVLVQQLTRARNHGLRTRDDCQFWSYNSRLDEVQAALLRVQLRHLDQWTEERRRLAFRYNEHLARHVEVPTEGVGEYCVYQTYMIQADRRDALQRCLTDRGIEALVHYPTPLHLQPAAGTLGYNAHSFPQTLRAADRILSLPLYPGMTDAQQDQVIESIERFYRRGD